MRSEYTDIGTSTLAERLASLPGVDVLRDALSGESAYLVGGAVRDLLRGDGRADLDVAVEGEVAALARRISPEAKVHDRFGTATLELDGVSVDLAETRRETYSRPGVLPDVAPAGIVEDLGRRDFTVNAMALPLAGEPELIDPHDGRSDLAAGILRVLHERSFADDPSRALRAARYGARMGLELEAQTARLIEATDLDTISADRVDAELRRLVAEPQAPRALALLAEWGLAGVDPGAPKRLELARETLTDPAWAELTLGEGVLVALVAPQPGVESAAVRLAAANPASPSESLTLTRGRGPAELLAARVAGATWLDEWARDWRRVSLEITGADLMAAGVPEGPRVGAGLERALVAKLDGKTDGREDELREALSGSP